MTAERLGISTEEDDYLQGMGTEHKGQWPYSGQLALGTLVVEDGSHCELKTPAVGK